MTQEETKQLDLLHIDARIKTLDAEYHADIESRGEISGTRAEIQNEVADRIRRNIEYQRERMQLINRRNIIEGPSQGVADYINRVEPVNKFDIDKGTVEPEPDENEHLKGKDIFAKRNIWG